ncbi:triose-phosphate isomerase [Sedimentibacter sp. MB31-C6]|uniref:triose-phosphate isomerase n=1 Tax=Sedimentibacter sp. MB31-C6 TaxID=3109366 RepID=UPI002DDCDEB0|nr:triose-phosphate isomerase [Sedimentibacter sp. MB36-C1]WSI04089.1 triose-phosphate isomerase [Sedimentibacter sp. MB36-C1]
MRTPLIAGNWKMNNNMTESMELVDNLIQLTKNFNKNVEILICPPFTALFSIKNSINDSVIKLGAQNMHFEEKGAYTGEVSPMMLHDIGVEYVIIGHSERRQLFNETDDLINKKLKAALKYGIKPILCVGETLGQRESGIEKSIIKNQITNAFNDINDKDSAKVIIAYEPIWAIGTGKNATSNQANEMASFIRKTVSELYGELVSQNMIIQYGGSVKVNNANEILSQNDIDGALIGGASLKAEDFYKIINSAQ